MSSPSQQPSSQNPPGGAPANHPHHPHHAHHPHEPHVPVRIQVATLVAIFSAVFCLVIGGLLALELNKHKRSTYPLDHPQLVKLKDQLVREPNNEQLKVEIRLLDLRLRQAHDRYLDHVWRSRWFLLGGAIVFIGSMQTIMWRKKIGRPVKGGLPEGWYTREMVTSGIAVAVFGVICGVVTTMIARSSYTMLSPGMVKTVAAATNATPEKTEASNTAAVVPSTPFPSAAEVAQNWPRFRGPSGLGISSATNVPVKWNVQSGENIVWKIKTPGPDFNSPVAWGDRVFLTSASAKKREVFCYAAADGKLLWQKAVDKVPGGGAAVELPEISGGYACPTAATDGRNVYAMFANGDLAAFDFSGNMVWARSFAPIKNQYGHATSLDIWQNRLVVQLDHGDAETKVSKIAVVDTKDGKVVWEKPRESHGTWATPISIEAAGKPQIITLGLPHVIAYSIADGAELWKAEGMEGEITPSPIFAGGLVLAPSPSMKLMAIKPDGAGDVTKTHVAWSAEEGVPDISSPVGDGERVYLLTTGGTLTCYELKTGKRLYQKELDMECKASPSLIGDKLLIVGSKGVILVGTAGPEFKELGRSDLADEIDASPAFLGNRMFLRSKQTLFCVGGK